MILILLSGAPLGAVAAAGPDSLPGVVVGVVGSGDELSLRLTIDGAARTLKVGEIYQDGWRLQSLSAAEAVLTKDGETRRIGLNPAGALAQAPGAPSQVDIAGDTDADIARQLGEAGKLGKARTGLSQEETTRMEVYKTRIARALQAKLQALGKEDDGETGLSLTEIRAALGPDAADWLALDAKETAALRVETARQFAATGAVSFYVPAGGDVLTYATAAGVPPEQPAAYRGGTKDASGGRVYTRGPITVVSDAETAAKTFGP